MSEVLLITKVSSIPEIQGAMFAGISDDGLWNPERLNGYKISRDWLYWLRALESHPSVAVRPCFLRHGLWRTLLLRLGPEFPRGFGQPVDWFLCFKIARLASGDGAVLATSNLAISTALLLKAHGFLHRSLWCMLVGVADRLEALNVGTRKEVVDKLNLADRLLVWGSTEAAFLQAIGIRKVEVIPFGIDTKFWTPHEMICGNYVLSVGSDPLRDYQTLVDACPFKLKIVSSSVNRAAVLNPAQVSVFQPTCAELRDLYRAARVVAVVTHDAMQPSGQITVLQAMACGRPVILTRTRGTWSDKLISGENCIFVPAGDVQALREAIRFLWEHPYEAEAMGAAARAMVLRHYPFEVLRNALMAPLLEDPEAKRV